jgi:hypothetical protein
VAVRYRTEMTSETQVLIELRTWFAARKAALADSGYVAEFAESPPGRGKSSVTITVTAAQRIGQLTVWSTGEAELSMGDAGSGAVAEEHRENTSKIGLLDAAETLVAWVSATGDAINSWI